MIFHSDSRVRKYSFRLAIIVFASSLAVLAADSYLSLSGANHHRTSLPNPRGLDGDAGAEEESRKMLSLTFDDGPHPIHTPEVAGVLRRTNTPATFFLVGRNVLENRDIVRDLFAGGFEIGMHTFTHSAEVHTSERRLWWELAATNWLIERITGHSALLYRPPYLLDVGTRLLPTPHDTSPALRWAAESGYITVGSTPGVRDFEAANVTDLVSNLKSGLKHGPVILLHDGGGSRTYTARALERVIPELRAEGYEFVTLSQLLGLRRGEVMPAAAEPSLLAGFVAEKLVFSLIPGIGPAANLVVGIGLIVSIARVLVVLGLLIFQATRRREREERRSWRGSVSVVIPAFNEEDNIASCIRSVINSTRKPAEIIVVNDGSSDRTESIVEELRQQYPQLIKAVHRDNGGKPSALSVGYELARSSVVVSIDADTVLERRAVERIAQHFWDERVGAVAGKVNVARPFNFLTKVQEIEYTIGQNVDKVALGAINAVGIIPGAIGAWRRDAVLGAGGYCGETLTEDQDMTLAVLRSGYRVVYDGSAVCFTEAPETFLSFVRQRSRWVLGTIQCLWKYKAGMFSRKSPSTGFVVLPNILLYGTLVPLISPVIDLLALWLLLSGQGGALVGMFIFFIFLDFLLGAIAVMREQRWKVGFFLLLPIQRVFYRQVISLVVIMSVARAIEGSIVSWRKPKRTGQAAQLYLDMVGGRELASG